MIPFVIGFLVAAPIWFMVGAAFMAVAAANRHSAIPMTPETEVTAQ